MASYYCVHNPSTVTQIGEGPDNQCQERPRGNCRDCEPDQVHRGQLQQEWQKLSTYDWYGLFQLYIVWGKALLLDSVVVLPLLVAHVVDEVVHVEVCLIPIHVHVQNNAVGWQLPTLATNSITISRDHAKKLFHFWTTRPPTITSLHPSETGQIVIFNRSFHGSTYLNAIYLSTTNKYVA